MATTIQNIKYVHEVGVKHVSKMFVILSNTAPHMLILSECSDILFFCIGTLKWCHDFTETLLFLAANFYVFMKAFRKSLYNGLSYFCTEFRLRIFL